MRLLSLKVEGFRAFAAEASFDLDADAVVIVGVNGNGKTSIFDAILWALCARVPRLGDADHDLVCRFSEAGRALVELRVQPRHSTSPLVITRTFDGEESKVSVTTSTEVLRGPAAEGRLIKELWPEAAASASPSEALAAVLTRSAYLQQDLVRQFIDSTTDQERFAAVSELVGAGRVTDLQVELERAKAAWTKATNARAADLQPIRSRLTSTEARVAELKARQVALGAQVDGAAWVAWWERLKSLGLTVTPVPMDSREAAIAIDDALKQLESHRRASERRIQAIDAVQKDIADLASVSEADLAGLVNRVAALKRQLAEVQAELTAEQSRLADSRRQQAELQEKSAQLRALAALALRHLGERCPVCAQSYDIESTRSRLLNSTTTTDSPAPESNSDVLADVLARRALLERELSAAEIRLRTGEQIATRRTEATAAIERRLAELAIGAGKSGSVGELGDAAIAAQTRVAELSDARAKGEAFALGLAVAGETATIAEMEREIVRMRGRLQLEDDELGRRTLTGERAQRVIEGLRVAASEVVTKRVSEIEPLLVDMYGRIDVHPAFSVVRLLASVVRGRGHLSAVVKDPFSDIECDSPARVLSSSQMNALAVCVFLALNLSVPEPPLRTAILDDPLQSLDDINLLGLIDLLRRTKDRRQLCVSTHDLRFGDLLARKLRPKDPQQRTIVIGLEGWSRKGPIVNVREFHGDPSPLRLVSRT